MKDSSGVEVRVEGDWPADVAALARTAAAVLAHERAPAVEAVVVITGDETLHEMNRRYRGVDRPTDVLAFPDDRQGPFGGQPRYLGDVLISYPRAEEQAAAAGHSTLAELQLLVVHGLLHLLGYDDEEESEWARMRAAQEEVLSGLGVKVNLPE